MRCGGLMVNESLVDAFVSVSGELNRVNVTFSFFGLVSLWNDDGSRMLNWSLW